MRITALLLIAFSAVSIACEAQDLDFPDFRSKKDNFSKVTDKDIRADIASFSLAAVDESIGKAVLKFLPVKDYGPNFMSYEGPGIGPGNPPTNGENIQVTIRIGVFLPTKHKMMMQEQHLLRIDGKPYYGGIYGQPPHTTIEAVTVIVGKD